MNFHVITLFPDICQTYTDASADLKYRLARDSVCDQ
jgi:hypothetical protein